MATLDLIRARRDALAVQKAEAEQQYALLEQQLALLGRNIDGMHGGLQELNDLIATLQSKEE